MIRTFAIALCLAFAAPALAANAQQDLMKTCNAKAKAGALAGDARKTFMSKCLAGEDVSAPVSPQQRMKDCNAKAKKDGLSGDKRKEFMSTCLKAD